MLSINSYSIFLPDTFESVKMMGEQTGLSAEVLKVYHSIYGLNHVPVANDLSLAELLYTPVKNLICKQLDPSPIHYFIHAYTSPVIAPYGFPLYQDFHTMKAFVDTQFLSMNMYKCVSFLRALEILSFLLKKNEKAVVLTGEIAYTPKLRVVPNTTIIGDASTAVLVSRKGRDHILKSVVTEFVPGFSKGIYLDEVALSQFNDIFIQKMVGVIENALLKAGLAICDIKLILPHNINQSTWIHLARALSVPIEKIYLNNISKFAHCFCSDQILNLSTTVSEGALDKGDYYIMAACGLGVFMGVAVFQY